MTKRMRKKSRNGNVNARKRAMKRTNLKSDFFDVFCCCDAYAGVYCSFLISLLRVFICGETLLLVFLVQVPRPHLTDRFLF